MGASYPDVPSVLLPKTGGGTAQFDDTTIATGGASAADIASGKLAYVNGVLLTGTGSGGGGASSFVTGTFKGTTTGVAMDVTLNYTGSGYPVAYMVYPKDGLDGNPTFSALVQRYALFIVSGVKYNADTPTFTNSGNNNGVSIEARYKSSSSSATTYGNYANSNANVMNGANATSNAYSAVCFKSATKMSVFIASTYYGFAASIEYTYYVIYSS